MSITPENVIFDQNEFTTLGDIQPKNIKDFIDADIVRENPNCHREDVIECLLDEFLEQRNLRKYYIPQNKYNII